MSDEEIKKSESEGEQESPTVSEPTGTDAELKVGETTGTEPTPEVETPSQEVSTKE